MTIFAAAKMGSGSNVPCNDLLGGISTINSSAFSLIVIERQITTTKPLQPHIELLLRRSQTPVEKFFVAQIYPGKRTLPR
jgi:hypothetical protein